MFSNKTPQIAINLDYTILEQVCTVTMETRTTEEQLKLKLYKNLKTTSLGQNLLVLIKKKRVSLYPTSVSGIIVLLNTKD